MGKLLASTTSSTTSEDKSDLCLSKLLDSVIGIIVNNLLPHSTILSPRLTLEYKTSNVNNLIESTLSNLSIRFGCNLQYAGKLPALQRSACFGLINHCSIYCKLGKMLITQICFPCKAVMFWLLVQLADNLPLFFPPHSMPFTVRM